MTVWVLRPLGPVDTAVSKCLRVLSNRLHTHSLRASLHDAREGWRGVKANLSGLNLASDDLTRLVKILRHDIVREAVADQAIQAKVLVPQTMVAHLGLLAMPVVVVVSAGGYTSPFGWLTLYGGFLLPFAAVILIRFLGFSMTLTFFSPLAFFSLGALSLTGLPAVLGGLLLGGHSGVHLLVELPTTAAMRTVNASQDVRGIMRLLVEIVLSWIAWWSLVIWVNVAGSAVASWTAPPTYRPRSLTDITIVSLTLALFDVEEARWNWRRPDERRFLIHNLELLARNAERDILSLARYAEKDLSLKHAAVLRGGQIAAALRKHQQTIIEAVWQSQYDEVRQQLVSQVTKVSTGDWSLLPEPSTSSIVPRLRRIVRRVGQPALLAVAAAILPLLPGIGGAVNGARLTLITVAMLSVFGANQESRDRVVNAVKSTLPNARG